MIKMKFTADHYRSLKLCINLVYPTGIPDRKSDESETRFLWNIFWKCDWTVKYREHYYEGDYTDSHIQAALKNIVKELKKSELCLQ